MRAVRLLEMMGYRHVGHFGGGILHWRRFEFPFDTGEDRSLRPEERPGTDGESATP